MIASRCEATNNKHSLHAQDAAWLRSIQRCNLQGPTKVTVIVLVFGIALGAFLIVLGAQHDDRILVLSGAATLLFAPIICAARFTILRLYRIIQTISSADDVDSRRGSTDTAS